MSCDVPPHFDQEVAFGSGDQGKCGVEDLQEKPEKYKMLKGGLYKVLPTTQRNLIAIFIVVMETGSSPE